MPSETEREINENMIALHDLENVNVIVHSRKFGWILAADFQGHLMRKLDAVMAEAEKGDIWDFRRFMEIALASWYVEGCGGNYDIVTVRRGAAMLQRMIYNRGYPLRTYANTHITLD